MLITLNSKIKVEELPSGVDLNNYKSSGIYITDSSIITSTIKNLPESIGSGIVLQVLKSSNVAFVQIIYASAGGDRIYIRGSNSSGWGVWYKYNGTLINK